MIEAWAVFWWLIQHWWLLAWAAAVGGGYMVGGWRLALAIASLGAAWRLYSRGRADGRQEIERREQDRRNQLKERYDAIDDRPRDPDDAFKRLHDRSRGR